MKAVFILSLLSLMLFNGCLIFNKISYVITTDGKSGSAEVNFYDIRSDAENPSEFEEDKKNLFEYMWKSDEFLTTMKSEGKEIMERDLFLSNDTLNGKILFKYTNISNIENIVFEDGFFYLTLPLEDSIVSTNGEIIESREFKRILWDSNFDKLEFEILGFSFEEERYRPLGIHFKSLK